MYTGDNSVDQRAMFTPSFLWHSDVRVPGLMFEYPMKLTIPGYLRGATTIIHIIEALNRTTPGRWRGHFMVFSVRSVRCAVSLHANLPEEFDCSPFGRYAGVRLSGLRSTRPARTDHNRAPPYPYQSRDRLEQSFLQPGIRNQNCWNSQNGERRYSRIFDGGHSYNAGIACSFSMGQE